MGRKKKINKEKFADSWCFRCKDGGLLRVCDYKDCLKAYHPACVGKDEDFIESEAAWSCSWHFCFICKNTVKFQCFCCPQAVCGRCLCDAEFAVIRGQKGLCINCVTLAGLLEGVNHSDSDEGKVDFNAQDTYEHMFKFYWEVTKTKEALTAEHVRSASKLLSEGKNYDYGCNLNNIEEMDQSISDSEDEDQPFYDDSDSDEMICTRKRNKRKQCKQRNIKPKKQEFVGWGSKALFEFLAAIGKDISQELSQHDVGSVIIKYCNEHNLFHPEKKKKVLCDSRLQSLLGRKSVNKNSMHMLLSAHFADNIEQSEEEDSSESGEGTQNVLIACKRQRKASPERKSPTMEEVPVLPQRHFAAVIAQNIKLVYLKRSVVKELLRKPETFNEKLIGSFVRIKSDPNDFMQRLSHQLQQVTGIKKIPGKGKTDTDILLQVSNSPMDIAICKLSDDNFLEEECEDLCRRVKDGLLRRPIVVELEKKAKALHEDITKHWISRELARLQNLIDQANEKGWRRELFEYMERMRVLQTPTEQLRLLQEVPEVIADNADEHAHADSSMIDKQDYKFTPKPTLTVTRPCGLSSKSHGSSQWLNDGTDFPEEKQQSKGLASLELDWQSPAIIAHESKDNNTFTQAGNYVSNQEAMQNHSKSSPSELPSEHPTIPQGQPDDSREQNETVDAKKIKPKEQGATADIIVLSNDEDPGASVARSVKTSENLHQSVWHCVSPHGFKAGPYSMSVLKEWCDSSPYDLKFKVWKTSQSQEEAIYLTDAIRQFYPGK